MAAAATSTDSGSQDQFELYDHPKGGRIAGIALALLGIAFIGGVWYEFPQGTGERIGAAVRRRDRRVRGLRRHQDVPALAPFALPHPARRPGRADGGRALQFGGEPIYLRLPWSLIREFQLRQMGEAGYAMEVHAALPVEEEARLRALQKFTSQPGTLLFEVPVNWLPVRDAWIGDILRDIAARGRAR